MDNRFRFRAWDAKNYKYLFDIQNKKSFQEILNNNDFEIEKCTGFKDANGVLIYENDILQPTDGTDYHIVIFYDKDCGAYMLDTQDAMPEYLYEYIKKYQQLNLRLIGNVHENSELLENTN